MADKQESKWTLMFLCIFGRFKQVHFCKEVYHTVINVATGIILIEITASKKAIIAG